MDELDQLDDESFSEWAGRFVSAVNAFIDKFVATIRPYFDAITEIMKKFYDWIYSLYLEAGAPYGETPEGMLQWFEQRVRENQDRFAREKADKILWELPYRGLSPG